MSRTREIVSGLAILLVLAAWSANADQVFDNYNGTFLAPDTGTLGFVVEGPNSLPFWYEQGGVFGVPVVQGASGYFLTGVRVPIRQPPWPFTSDGGPNFYIAVHSEVGGLPGVELEVGPVATVSSTTPTEVTVSFSGGLFLQGGQRYWVVLKGSDDSNHLWLRPDPPNDNGTRASRSSSYFGVWRISAGLPAFRVEGTLVSTVPVSNSTWGRVKALYAPRPNKRLLRTAP